MNPDLRVEFRFKNAVLYRALQSCFGVEAEKQRIGRYPAPLARVAAEKLGVGWHELNELLNLKRAPYSVSRRYAGEPMPVVKRIAAGLGFEVAELFPPHLYKLDLGVLQAVEVDSKFIGLDAANNLPALGPAAEDVVFQGELSQTINEVLATFKPREREIIRLRFGLADGEEYTLDQIGRRVGVTPERIRCIESEVLRGMRKAGPRKLLAPFAGNRVQVKAQAVEAGDGE